MKTRNILLVLLAALTLPAPFAQAAAPSSFDPLAGSYSKAGRATVSGGFSARGKCRIKLVPTADGAGARLRITGDFVLDGARRSFSNVVVLRRENVAAISNLAPGIDDGHAVEDGAYEVSPRSIRVSFPFFLNTTQGNVSLLVRVKPLGGRRQLVVTQTLVTDAFPSGVKWTFRAKEH